MRKGESQEKFVILIEKRWIPHQAKENGKDEGENATTGSKKIDWGEETGDEQAKLWIPQKIIVRTIELNFSLCNQL